MKKLTMIFDSIDMYTENNKDELNNYILSLNGVVESNASYDNETGTMTFNITYDDNLIKDGILILEIRTFLKRYRYPSLIFFDKHFDGKTNKKEIKCKICCEFCFKIAIETLFELDGIVNVENNYIERYIEKDNSLEDGEDEITIYYDPKVISSGLMEKIIKELDM